MNKFEKIKRFLFLFGLTILLLWLFLLFEDYSGVLPLFIISFTIIIQGILFFIAARAISITLEWNQMKQENWYEVCYITKLEREIPFPFKSLMGELEIQSKYRGTIRNENVKLQILDDKIQKLEQTVTLPCGYSTITYRDVWILDLFGLFYKEYAYQIAPCEIVILPKLRKVNFQEEDIIELSGVQRDMLLTEAEEELTELKTWIPGEPLNRIHWKLSARTEETMMRVAEPAQNTGIFIYVSLCRNGNITESLERGFSLAHVLMEQNLTYDICWYDMETQELHKKQPMTNNDIEMIFLELMRSDMYETLPKNVRAMLGFHRKNEEKTFVFQVG